MGPRAVFILTSLCFLFLFIYLWLHLVFVAMLGLSLTEESGGYSLCSAWASHCAGFSYSSSPALESGLIGFVASRRVGIFLEQGSNLCPLHWQADSSAGSPVKSVSCQLLKVTSHGSSLGEFSVILQVVVALYCDSVVYIRWDEVNE